MTIKSKFNSLLENLSLMLTNSNSKEKWSTIRFTLLCIVLCSNLIVWGGILVLLCVNGTFPEVTGSIVGLYTLANTIGVGGKIMQKTREINELNNIK